MSLPWWRARIWPRALVELHTHVGRQGDMVQETLSKLLSNHSQLSFPRRGSFNRALALLRQHRGRHPGPAPVSVRNVNRIPVIVS